VNGISHETIAELTQLEERMWIGAFRYEPTFQEARFAADFTEYGRSGRTYVRAQMIRTESGQIDAKLPLDNLQFRRLDTHTIQITYNSHVRYGGIVEHGRRSSIWSFIDGRWQMRFHQGTPYTPDEE
jgi:hypothetical protein